MVKYITIILILISVQGFSQVKEINPDEFKKLILNRSLIYLSQGSFKNNLRGRIASIQNRFNLIELDTTTYKLHIVGQVYSLQNNGIDLTANINVGEIASEDFEETKMKFTHYFQTDEKGNYDVTFIINNKNSLITFNSAKRDDGLILIQISDIYQVGNLLK